jgi:hypothetical protein
MFKNLFIVIGLLSSILLTITTSFDLVHKIPPLYDLPYVVAHAAEEEEEEEEESSSKDEEEEKEEEEKEEEKESEGESEESSEEEPQNESIAQVPDIIENINQEAETLVQQEQQIEGQKEEVKNTLNELLNPQLPPLLANLTNDHSTNITPPNECNCTVVKPQPEPIPETAPPAQPPTGLEQIILSNRIIDYKVLGGEITDPIYTKYFGLKNAFDNIINSTSYWSQSGKVGFTVILDRPLSEYEVCSASIDVYKPRNVPFTLKIGSAPDYQGVLDSLSKNIVLDNCIKNVDSITMYFDSGRDFTSLAELKLFGKRLLGTPTITPPPTILQPTTPPTLEPTQESSNNNKIDIRDSTAEIDIKNSTVTFKFDPLTATFVGQPAN